MTINDQRSLINNLWALIFVGRESCHRRYPRRCVLQECKWHDARDFLGAFPTEGSPPEWVRCLWLRCRHVLGHPWRFHLVAIDGEKSRGYCWTSAVVKFWFCRRRSKSTQWTRGDPLRGQMRGDVSFALIKAFVFRCLTGFCQPKRKNLSHCVDFC